MELDVYSEGKHFMDLMLLRRRSGPVKLAIVGRNYVAPAAVLGVKRTVKEKQRETQRRKQSRGIRQNKYMHLRRLKKELKVRFYVNVFIDNALPIHMIIWDNYMYIKLSKGC